MWVRNSLTLLTTTLIGDAKKQEAGVVTRVKKLEDEIHDTDESLGLETRVTNLETSQAVLPGPQKFRRPIYHQK